jgi:hypothetical protein
MAEVSNMYVVFSRKPDGEMLFLEQITWKDNIKMGDREMGCEEGGGFCEVPGSNLGRTASYIYCLMMFHSVLEPHQAND